MAKASNGPLASDNRASGAPAAAPTIQLNILNTTGTFTTDGAPIQAGIKASDYQSLIRVEYLIDGKVVSESTVAPFTVSLGIGKLSVGRHTLQAYGFTASGKISVSEAFTFDLSGANKVQAADATSRAILHQALPAVILASATKNDTSGNYEKNVNNSSHKQDDGQTGVDQPIDTTPWPDDPPALMCGSSVLEGPASAPVGAISVPAGNNSGFNFGLSNTTYWFAPGTHTLSDGEYDQIAPGNNSTFTGGPGAVLDGRGINKYAFTQSATNVTIEYLTVQNFAAPRDEGVINHDSGTGWTVQYVTAKNNSGGAVFVGSNGVLRYSCLKDNGQYGFQVYSTEGPTNVLLDHNEITGNNTDDWESQQPGCGCTGGGKFWDAHAVTITNNYVHDNKSVGLWADTNDSDFLIDGNYIADNTSQGLFYEISYNMTVKNNNFLRNAYIAGSSNSSFPTGAIYLSESGGDNRVTSRTANIDIYHNNFGDNWSGVVLWENADRYCSSSNNTSSGYCTLVNPDATLTSCGDPATGGTIDQEPYTSDCRWKTQNVKVHDNTFSIDKSDIPNCTVTPSCGLQGIFSNNGSSPNWSPYMGASVSNDITFNQNNLFSKNTYSGDWGFMVKDQSKIVNYAIWQGAPYNQDAGSTLNGQSHLLITNALTADTAGIENGLGLWSSWYNDMISLSGTEKHGGSNSLRVSVGDQYWGIIFSNNGPVVTPANKTISFWVKQTAGTSRVTMSILWSDENQNLLRTDSIDTTDLTNNWQKFSSGITPPNGVDHVTLRVSSSSGTAGDIVYFDDFTIADQP